MFKNATFSVFLCDPCKFPRRQGGHCLPSWVKQGSIGGRCPPCRWSYPDFSAIR